MRTSKFKSYAILGSGRLARHLSFYLTNLGLPFQTWSRRQEDTAGVRLSEVLASASHILLAVKDEAIAELSLKASANQVTVHFSGALRIATAAAAHPLMTFAPELQSPGWYRQIPFVIDEGQEFADLLPGLPNPHYALAVGQRPYYHALCALAGNSTFLLWQQIGNEFENRLGLPRALLAPYLHQVVANALATATPANFTGPVARGDWQVVKAHLDSLHCRPDLLQAYRQYLKIAETSGHPVPETLL